MTGGQWTVQVSRLHPAPEGQVRVRLQPEHQVPGGALREGEAQSEGEPGAGRAEGGASHPATVPAAGQLPGSLPPHCVQVGHLGTRIGRT